MLFANEINDDDLLENVTEEFQESHDTQDGFIDGRKYKYFDFDSEDSDDRFQIMFSKSKDSGKHQRTLRIPLFISKGLQMIS